MQFWEEYRRKLGIPGNKAQDLAQFFAYLSEMANEECTVEREASGAIRLARNNKLLAGEDVPVEVYDALFQFPKTCAKVMSARVRITLDRLDIDRGRGARESWLIEDTKDRLY